ncbi:unnamed protein product [Musa acuminata subsp. malaccensis]|uniref:(wild Malaysian banana) hypothetical protein n=1 Tax=Musa acuminata subsp. malaccensis TaxID=214687 RepID=A0A8D7FFH2_MUSAM|nr:unnamed protein product [Musa acuminata subsp. malaccensis]
MVTCPHKFQSSLAIQIGFVIAKDSKNFFSSADLPGRMHAQADHCPCQQHRCCLLPCKVEELAFFNHIFGCHPGILVPIFL